METTPWALSLSLSILDIQDDSNLGHPGNIQYFFHFPPLSGVYTSNLSNDLDFYLGQILSLYEAKYLGQIFSQTFCFREGEY